MGSLDGPPAGPDAEETDWLAALKRLASAHGRLRVKLQWAFSDASSESVIDPLFLVE